MFEKAFKNIISYEGGFVNDKDDKGGKTKYGITEYLARAYGYEGDMKDFSSSKAKEIYYKEFWANNYCPKFNNYKVAFELFEQAVNMGNHQAIKHLQQSYNLLSTRDIVVDGIMGSNTLSAVNGVENYDRLYKIMNCKQASYYIELAEKDETQEKFLFGWLNKRVDV